MTIDEEVALLRAENECLKQQLAQALEQLTLSRQHTVQLEQRIAELEQGKAGPPSFAKPNRLEPTQPKSPRRKRAPEHNRGRPRQSPTHTEPHALAECPECKCPLHGTSIDYIRQVIELPAPQPVEVIEHQVIKRRCPQCGKWHSPQLDLTGQVLGQGRIGVRIISLIAYLRHTLRLPVRRIKEYLEAVHQLSISVGEIADLLHHLRRATKEAVEALKQQIRASAIIHADETGWRENGQNGYLWAFCTVGERAIRYYEYDPSRGQAVVRRILGQQCAGYLVSDFYAGYNDYTGPQQRCWVHFLRDLHELKEKQGQQGKAEDGLADKVLKWAQAVEELYEEAQGWLKARGQPSQQEREEKYVELVERAYALGAEHAQQKQHPCQALAKRILRHESELFRFVLVEGLSANNNLAERSIRPMVVVRKISGGSRSSEGSKTRMALASLFETWQARGQNPFLACLRLLSQPAMSSA